MSDDAQEARHLFRLVAFFCSLVFGVPLAVIVVKLTTELFGNPAGPMFYDKVAVGHDAIYLAILSALILLPMLASYIYYRRVAEG